MQVVPPGGSDGHRAGARGHHADVGGTTPGSMPVSTHIEEEGLRIPPSVLNDDTLTWICQQTRTPEERRGDLQAQTAALKLGASFINVSRGEVVVEEALWVAVEREVHKERGVRGRGWRNIANFSLHRLL